MNFVQFEGLDKGLRTVGGRYGCPADGPGLKPLE
jgi:hypothetical protein